MSRCMHILHIKKENLAHNITIYSDYNHFGMKGNMFHMSQLALN